MGIIVEGLDTLSRAEQYVKEKGWATRDHGEQINVQTCPLKDCGDSRWKFYINRHSFQWKCHKCDVSGNEWSLKTQLGDTVTASGSVSTTSSTSAAGNTGHKGPEPMPDADAMHAALMADDEVLNYLNDERGWSPEIIERMKIGVHNRWLDGRGKVKCLAYPYFIGGVLKFCKWRTLEGAKGFSSTQGHDNPLYNQDAITKDMEWCICVEGEADTLSVLSASIEEVVGIPGCDSKKVTWDKHLSKPKKKYLLFDNDEKGQAGAYEFAIRFGIEQFWNIKLPDFKKLDGSVGKDITEWFAAGHTKDELLALMDDAEQFSVAGVIDSDDAIDESLSVASETGTIAPKYQFRWQSVNAIAGGYDPTHLVGITAPGKIGKTTFALNELDHQADQGYVCMLYCLEMDTRELAQKEVASVAKIDMSPYSGKDLEEKIAYEKAKFEEYKAGCVITKERNRARLAKNGGRLLFGYNRVTKMDEVFATMEAAHRRYGVDIFAFDNLQYLVDNIRGDRNANRAERLSQATKRFKSFAMEKKVAILLIMQPKKLLDGMMATSNDIDGTGAAEKDVNGMLVLHRNPDARMKTKATEMESVEGFEVHTSLSPVLIVSCDRTRSAPGGLTKLYIDGAKSWVREMYDEENVAPQVRVDEGIAVGALPEEMTI